MPRNQLVVSFLGSAEFRPKVSRYAITHSFAKGGLKSLSPMFLAWSDTASHDKCGPARRLAVEVGFSGRGPGTTHYVIANAAIRLVANPNG